MNPLVLLYSIFANFLALAMYVLFWYVLPATAAVLILFMLGPGLFLLLPALCYGLAAGSLEQGSEMRTTR